VLRFSQVDVFTAEFLLGNPVAVVHDADGLSEDEMLAFARWTNLSETTFLLQPTQPAADYRLRIFTTARELPFAGHPTLGSARAWLAAGGMPKSRDLVQECGAGLVRIRRNDDRLAFAAPPLLRGGPVDSADIAELAAAIGVDVDEVIDAQWACNGPNWVALLLADADRVLSLNPDPAGFGRFPDIGVIGPYPPGSEVSFEVRAFLGNETVTEDPVTGSLNAGLAQWLIPTGRAPKTYIASQGTRLQRRGRIHVAADEEAIWIGGDTVIGITGTVALPIPHQPLPG
jgi:PhzF family phenazine biosynthesis protein